MSFKKVVECGRCGLTTTYTNEVELKLWQERPGCPACSKRDRDDDEADEPEYEPRAFEPHVTIEGEAVQVLAWSVVLGDDGRDTGRRVLEVLLP